MATTRATTAKANVGFDARGLRQISHGVLAREQAEREIAAGVAQARSDGVPWVIIGERLGLTARAAQQRYRRFLARKPA